MYVPHDAALIGMVHLEPLPGSPRWSGEMAALLAAAVRDAEALLEGGCDALIVENMGDLPYLRGRVDPETVAAMALAVDRVRQVAGATPVGLQLLAAANREALGVAVACGARFLRVEGFAYAHVADEGWIEACAADLLRARRALGADVAVWADIQKKHSAHAVTADLDLGQWAHGAAFCGADCVIVTGEATGASTPAASVTAARAGGLPVAVGSGVTPADAAALGAVADGLIVGSALKVDGRWRNPVDVDRVRAVRAALSTRG